MSYSLGSVRQFTRLHFAWTSVPQRVPPAYAFTTSVIAHYKKATETRRPRNNEIKCPVVQVVDPETQRLRDPVPLKDVLNSVELEKFFIELVSADPPVVKIISRSEAHAAKKAAKAKQKTLKADKKEYQMTWNISPQDLTHKIQRAREQLESNNLVDVAFAPKPRQKAPSLPEMHSILDKVKQALLDVAMERQERTIQRAIGVIYFRPRRLSDTQ